MNIATIGLDIAKHVFQVHGVDANENVVVRKALRRSQMIAFFSALPRCLIGIEACATAHYWARELTKLGHEVRLMPAKQAKLPSTTTAFPSQARTVVTADSTAAIKVPCSRMTSSWASNSFSPFHRAPSNHLQHHKLGRDISSRSPFSCAYRSHVEKKSSRRRLVEERRIVIASPSLVDPSRHGPHAKAILAGWL